MGKSIAASPLVRLLVDDHREVPQEAVRLLEQLDAHTRPAVLIIGRTADRQRHSF
jgi:hypothetical protein